MKASRWIVLSVAFALSACAHPPREPVEPVDPAPPARERDGVGQTLELLQEFAAADAADRARLYATARRAVLDEPGAHTHLEYGLLAAWPGHAGSSVQTAHQHLTWAVQVPNGLGDELRALAELQRASLGEHFEALGELRRLESELAETRMKLEALTEIEMTVNPGPSRPREQADDAQIPDPPGR